MLTNRRIAIAFGLTALLIGAVVLSSNLASADAPAPLPTVSRALAAKAGTNLGRAHESDRAKLVAKTEIERQAAAMFPESKIRESDVVFLDDDVVAPAIHQDVWAASLDFPNGVSPVPAPGSGERTKYSYFVAFFDAKTGAFLFAESQ